MLLNDHLQQLFVLLALQFSVDGGALFSSTIMYRNLLHHPHTMKGRHLI